jgi:hypothetical protein
MMRSLLTVAAFSLGLLAHSAFAAELDQLSIQLSSRFGQTPSISTLTFTAGKPGYFVITGRFNDLVTVSAGGMRFTKDVRAFWNNQVAPLETIEKTQLADGRSRVLVKINSPQTSFNGGVVRIASPTGVLLDEDPIVVK